MSPSPAKPTPANATKNASEPTKPLETKPVAETKAAVEPQATETHAAQAAPAETPAASDKTILSLSVSEKFARNVRMLAKLTGKSMSALVLAIVEPEVKAQLKVALANLRDDVE
jgi:hypothetical protein